MNNKSFNREKSFTRIYANLYMGNMLMRLFIVSSRKYYTYNIHSQCIFHNRNNMPKQRYSKY